MIKQSIVNAPFPTTPNFLNPFTLYTFSLDTSYPIVLIQLNDQQIEAPISFFNSNLQGAELNYSFIEKQEFVVFKAIKHFRSFLLKNHTKIIVPFSAVRQLLMQRELGEKRANWVTALQEYDAEIRPYNIVRGQGFFGMLTGASHLSSEEDSGNNVKISKVNLNDAQSQYDDLIFYLKNGYAPTQLINKTKRALRLKSKQY